MVCSPTSWHGTLNQICFNYSMVLRHRPGQLSNSGSKRWCRVKHMAFPSSVHTGLISARGQARIYVWVPVRCCTAVLLSRAICMLPVWGLLKPSAALWRHSAVHIYHLLHRASNRPFGWYELLGCQCDRPENLSPESELLDLQLTN